MRKKLVIGTRGSKLALWQANHIADCLRERYPELVVTLEHMVTTGDKILDVPLAKIGGKGLFTKELETAMLQGDIDLAVHSLKDMPTVLPDGLVLAAITEREHPWDALVSPRHKTLAELPQGAKVGTSSLRRKAQLLNIRPDLVISDLRGNLDTRLKKLATENLDAIVLAEAGLRRLGWDDVITEILPPAVMLPAVGQGALAIEARSDDSEVLALLAFLNHEATREAATAERSFLNDLEGGCQVPIGVYCCQDGDDFCLEAAILALDGSQVIRETRRFAPGQADEAGRTLAAEMRANGGQEILADVFR